MDSWEFCREVIKHIPRATKAERSAIRRELQDHVLDAAQALEEGGCSSEDSMERAVARMGDPAEIGQALNAQLSPLWLWLGRGCLVLALGFCILLLSNSENLRRSGVNLMARLMPSLLMGEVEKYIPEEYTLSQNVDLKLDLGDEVIRVCRIYMTPGPHCLAGVGVVRYSEDPYGWASYYSVPALYTIDGQRGDMGSNYCPYGVTTELYLNAPVKTGDPYMVLASGRQGWRKEIKIPLTWEVES